MFICLTEDNDVGGRVFPVSCNFPLVVGNRFDGFILVVKAA